MRTWLFCKKSVTLLHCRREGHATLCKRADTHMHANCLVSYRHLLHTHGHAVRAVRQRRRHTSHEHTRAHCLYAQCLVLSTRLAAITYHISIVAEDVARNLVIVAFFVFAVSARAETNAYLVCSACLGTASRRRAECYAPIWMSCLSARQCPGATLSDVCLSMCLSICYVVLYGADGAGARALRNLWRGHRHSGAPCAARRPAFVSVLNSDGIQQRSMLLVVIDTLMLRPRTSASCCIL